MLLELDDFHRLALTGKTNGVQITKAVDMTNTAHQELLEYGKYRIMSCLPIDLYTKVRKQEALVYARYHKALGAGDKDTKTVKEFVKSAMSLCKGYEVVVKTAKDRGLHKLDLDFFNLESSDGKEIYVVPTEDMKAILRMELDNDNLCIYSMSELSLLLDDKIAYELKTKFNATLTGVNSVDKTNTH
tara:strand:+ start:90 stop:650 length:561 start_codon:yes stop_codon:yes gene_type:complete